MTIFANCHIFKKNPEIVIYDKKKTNVLVANDNRRILSCLGMNFLFENMYNLHQNESYIWF